MSGIVTRFAPSPTGFLHIGGARTALLNWLYAKHHKGKFLLRIEDTDQKRSTQEAIDIIIEGLKWLSIDYDEEIVYQSQKVERHIEVSNLLLQKGKAYYCSCPKNEKKKEIGMVTRHKCNPSNKNINPVVRFKIEDSEEITINDKVYGKITINSSEIDDIIILRSDKTPTYIFAVVVDDHDAGVTHIIRGSDHITNSFKQLLLYQSLGFNVPDFAHVPLIHDMYGNKLSKRHGATSIAEYKTMGILPEAMRYYLLRLGWSHGNDEIITYEQSIEWFNLENIGRSPSCLDFKKLEYLNNYYISNTSNENLLKAVNTIDSNFELSDHKKQYVLQGLTELKKRAHYLTEIPNLVSFYIDDIPLHLSEEARQIIYDSTSLIELLVQYLLKIDDMDWKNDYLHDKIHEFSKDYDTKIANIYRTLRAPITGMTNTPGIINIMVILGKNECIKRLKYVIA